MRVICYNSHWFVQCWLNRWTKCTVKRGICSDDSHFRRHEKHVYVPKAMDLAAQL